MTSPLKTPPPVLRAKLDRILHEGFVHIRNLGTDLNDFATAADRRVAYHIADTLEPIPTLFHRWNEPGWELNSEAYVRELIGDLARTVPHLGERFRMLLDMPDEEYEAFYLTPRPQPGDEPAVDPAAPPAARAA